MAIIKSKPTSPGRRGQISIKSDLYKGKPLKSLIEPKSKKGGRNNNGRNHCKTPRWWSQTAL